MNTCDYDHMTNEEIRIMPYWSANLRVCKEHFEKEMAFNRNWNHFNEAHKIDSRLSTPSWHSLQVYAESVTAGIKPQ